MDNGGEEDDPARRGRVSPNRSARVELGKQGKAGSGGGGEEQGNRWMLREIERERERVMI